MVLTSIFSRSHQKYIQNGSIIFGSEAKKRYIPGAGSSIRPSNLNYACIEDKAVTMGHIKRSDLEVSEILIPQMDILAKLDAIINPLFSQIIEMKCENRNLATIRDILLPRLMSGTLKIDDLNR